jgi:hypothetical protein
MTVSAALLGFDLGTRVLATNDEARFPMMAPDILANGHGRDVLQSDMVQGW